MKKFLVLLAIICTAGFCTFTLLNKKDNPQTDNNNTKVKQEVNKTENNPKSNKIENKNINLTRNEKKSFLQKEESFVKKTNLYNEIPSSTLPLSAISEVANLPENIQNLVSQIISTNNIYMIQKHNNKVLIITNNPENLRHNVEFTEISLTNGQQTETTLGYNDKIKDSDNDIWEYDFETKQPTRHTKYNKDGDMEFVEVWNYDSENPIKYEMKDSNGNPISLRKETLQDGTNLRVEHLLYDSHGKTRMNVSATFEGEDLKRFTYYNSDKPDESGSIFSDYTAGQKTKETVYTSDLKVKNVYTSDYKDGNRTEIIKWDNNNKEVQKLIPTEEL